MVRAEQSIGVEEEARREVEVMIYDESRVGDMTACNIYITRQLATGRMETLRIELHFYSTSQVY